jgi:mannose-6-phosphate isomerase-like protein (cupin superfamily)
MRTNVTRLMILGLLVAASALTLSAQGRAGGRGPAPLSTSVYDKWTPEQLAKPGNLGNYGNHSSSIQRRDVGAAPETHDGFSHILMFTSGEGKFLLGGEIVDGPDGKKMIRGGDTHQIKMGELYHIPIKVAHQVIPNPGSSVTYFVTNINVEKQP